MLASFAVAVVGMSASFSPSIARLVRVDVPESLVSNGSVTVQNIRPGIPFSEVIPSWNLEDAKSDGIEIEIRPRFETGTGTWFSLGKWSLDPKLLAKGSVEKQKAEDGQVLTDVLRLKKKAVAVDVRLTLKKGNAESLTGLKLLALSFSNRDTVKEGEPRKRHSAWGKTIDVFQRAQGNYPRGSVLCSATSTSMLLNHWSKVLGRPALDKDVPEVEANVWDPVYDGAGNWPFNTAYMGSFPELTSYVSRLTCLRDLEDLIDQGIPVACSVSFDMLRGRPLSPKESGHLVLVVGFTEDGTPVFNDPAFKEGVRKTYPRDDFEKAWNYSARTVYIVHPIGTKLTASKVWIGES